jgi:hypothetical protein
MKLFVMVAVSLFSGSPGPMQLFAYPSLEACEAGRKEAAAAVLAPPVIPGFDIWTKCVEVDREIKPQADPKHRDPKSEKRS